MISYPCKAVTLLDGTQAPSNSEAWRHECEARAIAAMQPLDKRRAWLAEVERRRGKEAADRLRATMAACWQRTRTETKESP